MSDEEIEELAGYGVNLMDFMSKNIPREKRAMTLEWLLSSVFGRPYVHDQFPAPLNMN